MPEETPSTETVEQKQEAPQTETVETLKAQLDNVSKALKEANAEAAKRRKKLDEIEAAEAKRKQDEMSEADKVKAELEAARQELTNLRRERLQREAAEKAGLPPALASRLQGETLEDLVTDAKAVLEAIPKPKPQASVTNPGGAKTGETDAERRKRLLG